MGKRFTDTEKWKDEWWGSLDNDYRMIWLYLVDSCSIAGIWKKDFRGLNFNCNTKITEDQFLEVFGSRLIDRGNYFFIPKFLRFQCPKGLNSNKPAVVSIVKEIHLNNLSSIINELFGNDFLIIKDKGKDKGKEKDKGEGTEKEQPQIFTDDYFKGIFDEIYVEKIKMTYPKHNLAKEFDEFKLKVRGSPDDYKHRDTGGIRNAFLYQLKNTKLNGTTFGKHAQTEIRRADATIEEGKDFGQL